MRVRHNGTEQSVDSRAGSTLAHLVEVCLRQQGGEVRVLTGLHVDGREVRESSRTELATMPLEGIEQIEIESEPVRDVALSALENARDYVEQLGKASQQTATLFRGGRIEEANHLYADVIDAVSVLLYTLSSAGEALGSDASALQGTDAEIQPWLAALLSAQERRDWVSVADYLEYEVAPVFEGWRRRIRQAQEACAVREECHESR